MFGSVTTAVGCGVETGGNDVTDGCDTDGVADGNDVANGDVNG